MQCWNDILTCLVVSTSFTSCTEAVDLDGKFIRVDSRIVFNFGKYRGRRLDEIAAESPNYLLWMLDGSFMDDTKEIVRGALEQTVDQLREVV